MTYLGLDTDFPWHFRHVCKKKILKDPSLHQKWCHLTVTINFALKLTKADHLTLFQAGVGGTLCSRSHINET